MTNKRDPDKRHISAYVTVEEKEKLKQLQFEYGCKTLTDLLRCLIREQEPYGRYKAPTEFKPTVKDNKDVD